MFAAMGANLGYGGIPATVAYEGDIVGEGGPRTTTGGATKGGPLQDGRLRLPYPPVM
jgi:hypothetical protein